MVENLRIYESECRNFKDLTCGRNNGNAVGKKNFHRSNRDKEIYSLSEKNCACIEKSSTALSDILKLQENAEHSLFRAKIAILNRLKSPAEEALEKTCVRLCVLQL